MVRLGRPSGALLGISESVAGQARRFDVAVRRACARERDAVAELDWKLGAWAGLGDRRTVEATVDAQLTAYQRAAVEYGAQYGKVRGMVWGSVFLAVAMVVGVVVNLLW